MLAEFLSKYKAALSLAFTVLFSLSGLIWQSNILARTASQAVELLDLFTAMMDSFAKGFSRFFDSYRSYSQLQKERDLLRQKLQEAQEIQLRYLQLVEENQRLRQLLSLSPAKDLPLEPAEVISQDPDNWFRTIVLNKGRAHGIEPYMPVLAYQVSSAQKENQEAPKELLTFGVVGKVIQVNHFSSRVLPITDSYSRLGILLRKTGHWALLVGRSPSAENPILEYLSLGVFLNPGDEIVTSGGDGIFPKGLPVGLVGNRIERLGSFQRAEVVPFVDFSRLDYVFILKKKPHKDLLQFPALSASSVPEPPLVENKTETNKTNDSSTEQSVARNPQDSLE